MSLLTSAIPLPYRILAVFVIAVTLFVGGFAYGKHLGDQKSQATIATYTATRDKQDLDLLGVNLKTSDRIVVQTITQVNTIHDNNQKIQTIIRTVPDTSVLSAGWMRTYNLSASGVVPSTTSGTEDATPTIKATDALSGIADNNATCLIYKQRAEAIIAFEDEVQKNINAANKVK